MTMINLDQVSDDLDGDGVPDLAVGAYGDNGGAVWVILMNRNGSVKYSRFHHHQ